MLCRALGFANNSANIVSYTIIEYTDSSFATAKSHEKGFGILTLGSSTGIANCTLARTTKQSSATSLNSQPATQNFLPGTGITIGTAANTLVFIGPSVMDIPAFVPYYDSTIANSVPPVGTMNATTGQAFIGGSGSHGYNVFDWRIPMLVKRCRMANWSASTGTTNLYAALYSIGTNGRPDRLLIDFGVMGTAGASLNTAFSGLSSAVHSTGFFLMPGEYYFNFRFTIVGGTFGSIESFASSGVPIMSGRMGAHGAFPVPYSYSDTSGTMTPAPDPAYVTGWATSLGQNNHISFGLAPS